MILEGYTADIFVKNFIKDSEVFGEDTTKALYEEIFSTICGKKIKLDGLVEELNKEVPISETDETTIGISPEMLKTGAVAGTAASAAGTTGFGLFSKLAGFFKAVPGKVKAFFGGLKGKSFGEIMKNGLAWVQANPKIALGTTGGIALVAMMLRALKKRRDKKKYEQLQSIVARQASVKSFDEKEIKEAAYDIVDDNAQKKAMRAIIEECKTNKALNELIFEREDNSKKSNFLKEVNKW